jgi:hypothetical protein
VAALLGGRCKGTDRGGGKSAPRFEGSLAGAGCERLLNGAHLSLGEPQSRGQVDGNQGIGNKQTKIA